MFICKLNKLSRMDCQSPTPTSQNLKYICKFRIVNFNLPSIWWVSLLQKSEFAVLVLGFQQLGLGLDNCGRMNKNAYCRIYSLCSWPMSWRKQIIMWRFSEPMPHSPTGDAVLRLWTVVFGNWSRLSTQTGHEAAQRPPRVTIGFLSRTMTVIPVVWTLISSVVRVWLTFLRTNVKWHIVTRRSRWGIAKKKTLFQKESNSDRRH